MHISFILIPGVFLSERVRLDTARLVREVDDKTCRTQGDVGKKLGERLGDIHFWKTEVNNEIDNMITEIDALQRSKQVNREKYTVCSKFNGIIIGNVSAFLLLLYTAVYIGGFV